jgi:hypothetical protein
MPGVILDLRLRHCRVEPLAVGHYGGLLEVQEDRSARTRHLKQGLKRIQRNPVQRDCRPFLVLARFGTVSTFRSKSTSHHRDRHYSEARIPVWRLIRKIGKKMGDLVSN